ncbi:hypothetical protein SAMN04489745_0128 [Arthrobacter woluwensis]|uniref:MarR family transcriptional regulator n=2 Tax=Arthrobacter woluwensis TaxID=156980 RepID=A0A1H4I6V8_9MICC|nr:hypothetical protein SAMN04489745_0055 [Arthrobacter woluwensis]SEB30279.1 hypothetical protein SAMN04489745_0128 [Arthrobacter woluwensis]
MALLSTGLRVSVMAYLNSAEGREGVTKAMIADATGVSMGTINATLIEAEKRGLLTVKVDRVPSQGGVNRYYLDHEKYESAVQAWLDFALGKGFTDENFRR